MIISVYSSHYSGKVKFSSFIFLPFNVPKIFNSTFFKTPTHNIGFTYLVCLKSIMYKLKKKNSIPKTQLLTMHNVHIIKFDFSLRWTDPLHIWTWRFEFAISHLNFPLKFLRAWRATKTLECSFQKYNITKKTVISWKFFGVLYIVLPKI